ncbi:hypothetical protein TH63_16040 [Rufibacter radiotolerans]|uniref:Activator of Hsp90 ATPase homologue 1/2-like C-terminal domain-containing protein n=1 Tax=Rufibacter radiotolerans TaxID=1379910 RepID=A0A0H4VSP2_9BACT|nr:SRPBCC domain-containing protein [Rufibacter radiotolerans]AKQ46794.1 hypothetical protein TH63_16040 [Rufibacter radiotolerans]
MERKNETASTTEKQGELVLTLALDAPLELVYSAWTQADHLAQWWGAEGYHLEVAQLDVRPGGTFLYSMQRGDGPKLWGKFVYHEITAPDGLVFVNAFSDEDGNILRAPFSPTWPQEMLNRVTLTEADGKTTVTLKISAYNASPAEEQTFAAGFDAMRQGFKGTFDKLKANLRKQQG